MDWGRLRGQAAAHPFGIVTVGQHARNGEPNAYLAHTIHTPPIESFWINGIHVAEIGESVLCFSGVPYIANVDARPPIRKPWNYAPRFPASR